MKFHFVHVNFNVRDLEKSMKFYEEALGLKEVRRKETDSFTIVYLGDGVTDFELELTWLRDHPQPYDLGEQEFHLALRVDDFAAAHRPRGIGLETDPRREFHPRQEARILASGGHLRQIVGEGAPHRHLVTVAEQHVRQRVHARPAVDERFFEMPSLPVGHAKCVFR